MKNNTKITFCALLSALSAVLMLTSYFPYLTYAIPAMTGLMTMVVIVEIDKKWALYVYLVSSVLIFLFAELEAKVLYVCLFGYYPILKALIEKLDKPVFEWIVKVLVFNIAVIAAYSLSVLLFGLSPDEFGEMGKYGVYILLGMGNVFFVFYDIAISNMSLFYIHRIHPRIKKFLR